jgi:hypothetical protein
MIYRWHEGQNTSGEKWLFTGQDGCRDSYEITFCAPVGAVVEVKEKTNYNASNDTYFCRNGRFTGTATGQSFLQTAYINGNCLIFCAFGSGLAGAAVQKIGKCSCELNQCRIDCPSSPDGFCCIDHALTDRLLQTLQN